MEIEAITLAYSIDIILILLFTISWFYGMYADSRFQSFTTPNENGIKPSIIQCTSIVYYVIGTVALWVIGGIIIVSTIVSTIQAIISLHNNQFNFPNPLRVFGLG